MVAFRFMFVAELIFILTTWGLKAAPDISVVNSPSLPSSTNQSIRLAIAGFATLDDGEKIQRQNSLLMDLLTAELSHSGTYVLIERQKIDSVAREMSLSLSQISKPADAIKVGKLLNVDRLLLGSLRNEAGTNTLIVKLVDARTGVICDLTAFSFNDTNIIGMVRPIAGFAINSAGQVSRLDQRVFIGMGQFGDLSINDRYPDFRKNLQTALEKNYQGTPFAIVERTMVDPLLNELRLNLGGLTESSTAGSTAQPAFLLIDGCYQSFQDENAKINLILRVSEIGGQTRLYSLKAPPGNGLDETIIGILSNALQELRQTKNQPSRKAEALAQVAQGEELARLPGALQGLQFLGVHAEGEDEERRVKNLAEAIEAFEAALLLDPGDEEARVYLAICLMAPEIGKTDSGRDYLSEEIAAGSNRELVNLARSTLAGSYLGTDDRQALNLLLAQVRDTQNREARERITLNLFGPLERLHQKGLLPTGVCLDTWARAYLDGCEIFEWQSVYDKASKTPMLMLDHFDEVKQLYNGDRVSAENSLETFLPRVVEIHPGMGPYIWTAYTLWRSQESSSVPPAVLKQLQDSLEFARDHPERIPRIRSVFLRRHLPKLMEWAMAHQAYVVGEAGGDILEEDIAGWNAQGGMEGFLPDTATELYELACCEREQGKGERALEVLGRIQTQYSSLQMPLDGPWGQKGTRISIADEIAQCRQHLGLPVLSGTVSNQSGKMDYLVTPNVSSAPPPPPRPPAFSPGEPVLTFDDTILFDCDGDQIWLTDGYAVFVYEPGNNHLTRLKAPAFEGKGLCCIRVGADKVWLGSLFDGLVEVDKQSKEVVFFGEKDGLLLPNISALDLTDRRLWIGYGHEGGGGVGYLDLQTHHFVGMTPELGTNMVDQQSSRYLETPSDQPPRTSVYDLCQTSSNDLWLVAWGYPPPGIYGNIKEQHLVLNRNRWETTWINGMEHVTGNARYTVFGGLGLVGGVVIRSNATGECKDVKIDDWLSRDPHVGPSMVATSLAIDGEKLWVGGRGYVAVVDLSSRQVEKLCMLIDGQAYVRSLQIHGDIVWMAAGNKLYRLPKDP